MCCFYVAFLGFDAKFECKHMNVPLTSSSSLHPLSVLTAHHKLLPGLDPSREFEWEEEEEWRTCGMNHVWPAPRTCCVFFCHHLTTVLTEWNDHSCLVDGLFVHILRWQPRQDPQRPRPGEQSCIENLKVLWPKFSSTAHVLDCDFIQLENIYLSHHVSADVEQRWVEVNSPVPQHTLSIVSLCMHAHRLSLKLPHTHTYTPSLWYEFIISVWSGPVTRSSVLSQRVKSGRKSKPFPSCWPLWVVVP